MKADKPIKTDKVTAHNQRVAFEKFYNKEISKKIYKLKNQTEKGNIFKKENEI